MTEPRAKANKDKVIAARFGNEHVAELEKLKKRIRTENNSKAIRIAVAFTSAYLGCKETEASRG